MKKNNFGAAESKATYIFSAAKIQIPDLTHRRNQKVSFLSVKAPHFPHPQN